MFQRERGESKKGNMRQADRQHRQLDRQHRARPRKREGGGRRK